MICRTFLVQIWSLCIYFVWFYKFGIRPNKLYELFCIQWCWSLPYSQITRWLYVQVRFILTYFAKHVAINDKAHVCDVIFWNFSCGFAMQCGKNPTVLDFLPARQIIRAGSAWMGMIHGFYPLTAGAEYIGFFPQLLPHLVPPFKHVKAIMWNESARFEKGWPPFCEIWIIFTHLELWIVSARHIYKCMKITIE